MTDDQWKAWRAFEDTIWDDKARHSGSVCWYVAKDAFVAGWEAAQRLTPQAQTPKRHRC